MAEFLAAAKDFARGEEGATMVEYAIMVALIAVVSIAVVTLVGANVNRVFGKVDTSLSSVVS